MPRSPRIVTGGIVYHVLNRGVNRMTIFRTKKDYRAFEDVMEETLALSPMRILAYTIMPNHWHMIVWPEKDGHLPAFMQRLTVTHALRWKHYRDLMGIGPLYQGRYRSFPVGDDQHFYTVVRYVERNALRANLVERAEDWKWSSLHRRLKGTSGQLDILSPWREEEPSDWLAFVNEPITDAELSAVRRSVERGAPYGNPYWVERISEQLGLGCTLRPRGRPKKILEYSHTTFSIS